MNNNNKFETHIYRCLVRFNPIIEFLDKSDVMQEIRIAILTCKEESVYRVAAKQAYRLATEYGYSKKMGKDNFAQYYANTTLNEKEEELLKQIEDYYHNQDLTAKQTAEVLGFEANRKVVKLLATCFPKNKSNRIKKIY